MDRLPDHPREDLALDLADVLDALEPEIEDLDAQVTVPKRAVLVEIDDPAAQGDHGNVAIGTRFDEPVENLLGISYESCCWGIKILAGQTGEDTEDFAETDNSIYFEFTFKGLSQAGDDIDAQLFDAIPGYRPAF